MRRQIGTGQSGPIGANLPSARNSAGFAPETLRGERRRGCRFSSRHRQHRPLPVLPNAADGPPWVASYPKADFAVGKVADGPEIYAGLEQTSRRLSGTGRLAVRHVALGAHDPRDFGW